MKISCQSCQAKYTIADEKVLGKIVKIRCKKCGATIVINGNETGAQTGTSTGGEAQAFDYAGQAGGEQWTVNVADGDQRTMSFDEIVAAMKSGVVTDETYCWKDGMGDWLPIREIPELSSALDGSAAPPDQTHQEPASSGYDNPGFMPSFAPSADHDERPAAGQTGYAAQASAGSNGNGAANGLFASSPAPAPAAARRQGRAGAQDLFGGVSQAGGEDDVMTSAPTGAMPQASSDPGKLTGQRNENSVLFSLNALTQSAPKEDVPTAVGEGSGLIDIRALSASMGNTGAPAKGSHVDDIMNLGGGGAFSAALAAPVLAPPSMDGGGLGFDGTARKDNTKLILMAIIGTGVLVALVIVLAAVLRKPAESQATGPMPTGTESAAPTGTTPGVAVAANDTAVPAAAAAATATGPAPTDPTAPQTGDNTGTGGHKHHAGGGGGGGGGGTGGGGGSAPAPFIPPAPTPAAPKGGGSLADQMQGAVGNATPFAAAAPAAQSSAPFDRGAAAAALGSVNVAGCKKSDGPTGSGHIKVTFAASGNVASAVVDQAPFSGTAVGGCVAGKFRSAHIPAFGGSPVTVGKSFNID